MKEEELKLELQNHVKNTTAPYKYPRYYSFRSGATLQFPMTVFVLKRKFFMFLYQCENFTWSVQSCIEQNFVNDALYCLLVFVLIIFY